MPRLATTLSTKLCTATASVRMTERFKIEPFADTELNRLLSQFNEEELDIELFDSTFSGLLNTPAHVKRTHIRIYSKSLLQVVVLIPSVSSASCFALKTDGQFKKLKLTLFQKKNVHTAKHHLGSEDMEGMEPPPAEIFSKKV